MRLFGRGSLLITICGCAFALCWLWQLAIVLLNASDAASQVRDLVGRAQVLNAEPQDSIDQLRARVAELRGRKVLQPIDAAKSEARIVALLREASRAATPDQVVEESFRTLGVVKVGERDWLQNVLILRLPPEAVTATVAAIESSASERIVESMRVSPRPGLSAGDGVPLRRVQLTLSVRTPMNQTAMGTEQ